MKAEYLTRQLDVIPLSVLAEPITVIGAGAVGSFTVLALSKMGFGNIAVWDPDKVDAPNINSQLYGPSQIGMPKVRALKALIHDLSGGLIETVERFYEYGVFPGIVISAVDSMKVREQIWRNHSGKAPLTKLIIDPRMAAEVALCYAINPNNLLDNQSYRKTLYTDAQAVQEACTSKSTAYCALGLASVVASIVKQRLCKQAITRTLQWDFKTHQLHAWPKAE